MLFWQRRQFGRFGGGRGEFGRDGRRWDGRRRARCMQIHKMALVVVMVVVCGDDHWMKRSPQQSLAQRINGCVAHESKKPTKSDTRPLTEAPTWAEVGGVWSSGNPKGEPIGPTGIKSAVWLVASGAFRKRQLVPFWCCYYEVTHLPSATLSNSFTCALICISGALPIIFQCQCF